MLPPRTLVIPIMVLEVLHLTREFSLGAMLWMCLPKTRKLPPDASLQLARWSQRSPSLGSSPPETSRASPASTELHLLDLIVPSSC